MKKIDEEEATLQVGDLVRLIPDAIGYPMFNEAAKRLGIGIVLEKRVRPPEWGDPTYSEVLMYRIMWSGTKSKRWEFHSDLVKMADK